MGQPGEIGRRARRTNNGPDAAAERLFAQIARPMLTDPAVNEGTGFGARSGLRLGTKIFAMLGRDDELVVKLPRARVDELVESGLGARFDPRRDGRLMKEWASVPLRHRRRWRGLVEEALAFARPAAGS